MAATLASSIDTCDDTYDSDDDNDTYAKTHDIETLWLELFSSKAIYLSSLTTTGDECANSSCVRPAVTKTATKQVPSETNIIRGKILKRKREELSVMESQLVESETKAKKVCRELKRMALIKMIVKNIIDRREKDLKCLKLDHELITARIELHKADIGQLCLDTQGKGNVDGCGQNKNKNKIKMEKL